jgi:hypothetical protein
LSTSNNKVELTETDGPDTTPVIISVTPQFYDANTFATALKTALDSDSPNGLTYTVTFSNATQKYTISTSADFTLSFDTPDPMYEVMGFNAGSDNNSTSNSLVSTNAVNFVGDRYVYITSNIVSGSDNGIHEIGTDVAGILAAVPVVSDFETMIYYENHKDAGFIDAINSAFNQNNNRQLTFALSLNNERTINLNGSFWSMRLLVEY